MKRFLPLMLIFLMGCSGSDPAMDAALALRTRCLGSREITFETEIRADYIEAMECFDLKCSFTQEGIMTFSVEEPEEIAGISGTVSGMEGTIGFDATILAFPMLADGRLSPVSAPWVMMKAIREGAIVCAGQEGERIHLTIDDSYADNALTVDLWLEGDEICEAEIAWEGRRCVTMTVDDFCA